MYTVTLDNALIHNPAAGDEACLVLNGVITKKVNCADSFSFTIYPANPAYSVISLMVSKIKVYKDGTCIFSGRPLSEETDFDNGKTVLCESDFAVLNDTIMRPYEFQGTVGDYVRLLVNAHNEATTSDKQITVGSITVTDPNNNIVRSTSDYVTIMEELIEKTVNNMGGYLRMIPGTMTLDYLQDSLDGTNQTLEIGKNILDFNRSISTEALATALIPLGKEDEETGERVTIKSVNGGSDYISDQAAENERGRIYTTMTWDDVSVPANLLTKARAALADLKRMASRIEMSAVDLKEAGMNVDSLDFFEYITVVDAVHNVSGQYLITERKYNLSAPEKDMVTFGGADNTISGQTSSARSAADRMGARIINTLTDIVERQTDLIKGGAGGHVVIGTDQDGKPNEIFFMDTDSVETARKILRINMNGIGFSTSGINGPYSNAWSIDGNLNASFIHTGILTSSQNANNFWNLNTGEISIGNDAHIAGWTITPTMIKNDVTIDNVIYSPRIQAPATPEKTDYAFYVRVTQNGTNSYPFYVTYEGKLKANNAVITGEVNAGSGEIAGWKIDGYLIYKDQTETGNGTIHRAQMRSGGTYASTNTAFSVRSSADGGETWTSQFNVTYGGTIRAVGGGTIGAWTLKAGEASSSTPSQGSLYSGMSTLNSSSMGVYIGYDGIALGGGKFKVTRDGDLTATSGSFTGAISGSSFTSTAEKIYTDSDFTQADLTAMRDFALGSTSPTATQLEKYDINRDGMIDIFDIAVVAGILQYGNTYKTKTTLTISPTDSVHPIKITYGGATNDNTLTMKNGTIIGAYKIQSSTFIALDDDGVNRVTLSAENDSSQLGLSIYNSSRKRTMFLTGSSLNFFDASGNQLLYLESSRLRFVNSSGYNLMTLSTTGLSYRNASNKQLMGLTTSAMSFRDSSENVLMWLSTSGINFRNASGDKLIDLASTGLTFRNTSGTETGTYSAFRASGYVSSWSVAANSTASQTISFGKTFPAAPFVWVQLVQSADNTIYGNVNLAVTATTTTGFTVRAFNANGTAVGMPFRWMTF